MCESIREWNYRFKKKNYLSGPSQYPYYIPVTSHPNITSCSSLVRVCTQTEIANASTLTLRFIPSSNSTWVHIAEVSLYSDEDKCRPDSVIITDSRNGSTTHSSFISVLIPVIVTIITMLHLKLHLCAGADCCLQTSPTKDHTS